MLKMTAAAAELTLSSAPSLLLLMLGTVLLMPAAAEWDRASQGRAEARSRKYASSSSSSSSSSHVDGGSGLRFEDFHSAGKEESSGNLSFTYLYLRSFVRSSLSSRDHPCQERGREEISQGDLLLPLFLLPREDDAWQLERETCKKAKAACSPHEAPSDAAAKTFLQPSPHDCSFVAPPTSFAYSCLSVKA